MGGPHGGSPARLGADTNKLKHDNREKTTGYVGELGSGTLLRGSRHPLLPGLQDDSWPPAPGVRIVPLESLDWEFGP